MASILSTSHWPTPHVKPVIYESTWMNCNAMIYDTHKSITRICESIKQNESELELDFLLDVILHSKGYSLQKKNPWKSDTSFQSFDYWKVVKTIENKQTYFPCLALSPNQYLWIPTHSAWSYHIWFFALPRCCR